MPLGTARMTCIGCWWEIFALLVSIYIPDDIPALLLTCPYALYTLRIENIVIKNPHLKLLSRLIGIKREENTFDINSSLRNLRFCNLTDFNQIPEDIFQLRGLRSLIIEKCPRIQVLPTSINFQNLKYLVFNNLNSLFIIPSQIGRCVQLNTIKIINCNVIVQKKNQKSLFHRLSFLPNLHELFILNCDSLVRFHNYLQQLTHLKYINLSWNKNLKALSYLHLENIQKIIVNYTQLYYYPFQIHYKAQVFFNYYYFYYFIISITIDFRVLIVFFFRLSKFLISPIRQKSPTPA